MSHGDVMFSLIDAKDTICVYMRRNGYIVVSLAIEDIYIFPLTHIITLTSYVEYTKPMPKKVI